MFSVIHDKNGWQEIHRTLPEPKTLIDHRYVSAAALLEKEGRAELAVWRSGGTLIAHPYIRRPIPAAPGFEDLRSPYEFGGFWHRSDGPAEADDAIRRFSAAFADYCREQRIVTEFVRFHPMLDRPAALEVDYAIAKRADNTVVRLDQPYEKIFAAYHQSRRNQVRQGRRNRLQLSSSDDFDAFTAFYHEDLDRLGANAFYYFPASFFDAVRDFLELWLVHDAEGTLCAAHCHLRDSAFVHAYFCHARHDKLPLRPNDFAYDRVIEILAGSGAKLFHFGGGAPSLAAYKRQFSPDSIAYYTGTRIFLPDVYRRLSQARDAETGKPGNSTDFFPAYRAG